MKRIGSRQQKESRADKRERLMQERVEREVEAWEPYTPAEVLEWFMVEVEEPRRVQEEW